MRRTHIPDEKGIHRRKQRTGDRTTAWDFSGYGAIASLVKCERDDDAILLFQTSECKRRVAWMANDGHRAGPDNDLRRDIESWPIGIEEETCYAIRV